MLKCDNDLSTGLRAAGFAVDCSIDGSGLVFKHLGGGNYCIEVGASKFIVKEMIKIRQG